MKKYLLSVLNAFFVEKSTFYSVYVATANGTRPLCEWFRNFNPPRVGGIVPSWVLCEWFNGDQHLTPLQYYFRFKLVVEEISK